jgi:hypothetical protein
MQVDRNTSRQFINTLPFTLGPMDLVSVSSKLNPSEPATSAHSIALVVERRLEFSIPPFGSVDASTKNLVDHSNPPSPSSKTSWLVTSGELTDVPRDENGIYMRTVTLQGMMHSRVFALGVDIICSHWGICEMMRTALFTL